MNKLTQSTSSTLLYKDQLKSNKLVRRERDTMKIAEEFYRIMVDNASGFFYNKKEDNNETPNTNFRIPTHTKTL